METAMAARKPGNRTAGSLLSIASDAARSAPPRPIAERGRFLYVEDIQELLAGTTGRRPTRWWVNHSFAPEFVVKVGRANGWWESDALRWLDEQSRDARARRSGT